MSGGAPSNYSMSASSFNVTTNASMLAADTALLAAVWSQLYADANTTALYNGSASLNLDTLLRDSVAYDVNGSMPLRSTAGSIWQTCGSAPAEAACALASLPLMTLLDALPLLQLRQSAADDTTRARLASWHAAVPPCNSSTGGNGTCVPCDDAQPDATCGRARPSDGMATCAWRYISCRAGRVIGVDMAGRVRRRR